MSLSILVAITHTTTHHRNAAFVGLSLTAAARCRAVLLLSPLQFPVLPFLERMEEDGQENDHGANTAAQRQQSEQNTSTDHCLCIHQGKGFSLFISVPLNNVEEFSVHNVDYTTSTPLSSKEFFLFFLFVFCIFVVFVSADRSLSQQTQACCQSSSQALQNRRMKQLTCLFVMLVYCLTAHQH